MSFPRYPEYKDSGVEWLEEVPTSWEISRLGFEAWVRARLGWKGLKAEEYVDDGVIFLATPNIKGAEIDFQNVNYISDERYDESPEIKLSVGDVLLAKDGSTLGTVNVVKALPGPTTVNSSIAVITPFASMTGRFLRYIFNSSFMEQMIQKTKGGMGVPHLFQSDLNKFYIPVPPIDDQEAVTAFLDLETSKIDALVAEQEKLIALLQEKRQAVISHAVTKGLDPNVPMKDSGVKWLGEVPTHWEVVPLALITTLIQTGPFGSQLHAEEYVEDQTPVINPANIRDGLLIPDIACTVTNSTLERLKTHQLELGDIIVGRRGEMGRCAVIPPEAVGWVCGTGCLNVRLQRQNADPQFVGTYLRTRQVREWLSLESVGSTMDNLNAKILAKTPVPCPPLEEQITLAKFLNSEATRFNTLMTEARTTITLLQERRTALISAAVTGQIDVRGLVGDADAPDSIAGSAYPASA